MRTSQMLFHTLRHSPAEADSAGHALLLRGGYIRQVAAGLFSFTPLGLRVKQRIEQILREEMNLLGAQEVSLARPHEEAATHLVRDMVHSYRQLPVVIYQLQTKFRYEPRARGGLIRVREFTMKDAYSFHANQEDLDEFYDRMHQAYQRIFERCQLEVMAVESDQGMMGGSGAHEFMALLPIGEDTLLLCDNCGYRANQQVARSRKAAASAPEPAPLAEVATPGATTIQALAAQLQIPASATAKAVLFTGVSEAGVQTLLFAVVRGDMELNETKLVNALNVTELRPATEAEIRRVGAEPGYASPIGLAADGVLVIVDEAVAEATALVAGANRHGYHVLNSRHGRDYQADLVADIATADAGDSCVRCGCALRAERGVEVGNIFKLGTKYSESMGAGFLDDHGQNRPFVMGSYGIGPGRLMACIAEAHHDDKGLVWPASVAPFDVAITPIGGAKEPAVAQAAEELYRSLVGAGLEVLLDDRDERAGVKFADTDLVGAPWRVTVAARGVAEGVVEVKGRTEIEARIVPLPEVTGALGFGPGPTRS